MTRKIFDGVLLMLLLSKPAFGLLKIEARRLSREEDGALGVVGDAVGMAL